MSLSVFGLVIDGDFDQSYLTLFGKLGGGGGRGGQRGVTSPF